MTCVGMIGTSLADALAALRLAVMPGGLRGPLQDREFMTMSRVFGEHGGMDTAVEVVHSMRTNLAQPSFHRGTMDREARRGAVPESLFCSCVFTIVVVASLECPGLHGRHCEYPSNHVAGIEVVAACALPEAVQIDPAGCIAWEAECGADA